MVNPEFLADPLKAPPKDGVFWSQLRVVLFAAAAVIALIVVNGKPAPAPETGATTAAVTPMQPASPPATVAAR